MKSSASESVVSISCFNGFLSINDACKCSCVSRELHRLVSSWLLSYPCHIVSSEGNLTDGVFTQWAGLSIVCLELVNCANVSDLSFYQLFPIHSKLKRLAILGCPSLSNEILNTLLILSSGLESIKVDRNVEHGMKNKNELRELWLYGNTNLNSSVVWNILDTYSDQLETVGLLNTSVNIRIKLSQLKNIILDNCTGVNDLFLKTIASDMLQVAYLGSGAVCSETGLQDFGNKCPALKEFGVSGNRTGTVCSFDTILCNCPIEKLSLQDNKGVSYNISYQVKQFCKLTHLNLSGCEMIDNKCAEFFATESLVEVEVAGTNIGNVGLKHICKTCTRLKRLNISKCPKLTDEGILAIPKWSRYIQCLVLRWSSHMTLLPIEEMVDENFFLSLIDLTGCIQVRPMDAIVLARRAKSRIKIILVEGVYIAPGKKNVATPTEQVHRHNKGKKKKKKEKLCSISVEQGVM